MIAVLEIFGYNTFVKGIFSTYKEAEIYTKNYYADFKEELNKNNPYYDLYPSYYDEFRWINFDFGSVDFDWEKANRFVFIIKEED